MAKERPETDPTYAKEQLDVHVQLYGEPPEVQDPPVDPPPTPEEQVLIDEDALVPEIDTMDSEC